MATSKLMTPDPSVMQQQQMSQQQQQLQSMLASGQAQYVMVPGVGLMLVPVMQLPGTSLGAPGMGAYQHYGAPMNYPGLAPPPAGPPARNSFKNTVLTLAAMAMMSADGLVYLVQFKRSQRNFILASAAPRGIVPGEFVIVEADRGEDIGVVIEVAPATLFNKDKHTAGHRWKGFATGQNGEIRKVLRTATVEERALLPDKAAEEAAIIEACIEKVEYQFQMPITIVDTEFQVDRHKLTIYYEAQRRIDFRELVRDLFALYKTRIWMAQVDSSFEPNLEAALSLQTGNYPSFAKFDPLDTTRVMDISSYISKYGDDYTPRFSSTPGIAPGMYTNWSFDQDFTV
jgi:hypothetical protein